MVRGDNDDDVVRDCNDDENDDNDVGDESDSGDEVFWWWR